MSAARHLAWILAGVAIAGACSKKPKASHSCGDRLDRFADHLRMAGPPQVASVPPGDFQSIRATSGSPATRYGPTLRVAANGQFDLAGRAVDKAALGERLAEELALWRSLAAPGRESSTLPLLIWFDRRADPVLLAQLKLAVPEDIEPMVLAVGESAADSGYQEQLMAVDSVTRFRRDTDAADPSERATMVAGRISDLIEGRCPELVEVFGAVATRDGTDKATFIAESTPPALRKCKCNVEDMPLLEYVLLAVLGVFDGPIYALSLDDAVALLPSTDQPAPAGTPVVP